MLICAYMILDIIVASYYLPWISSYYFVGWIVSLTLVSAFSFFFPRRVEFPDKNRSTGRTVLSESYHRFVMSRRGLVVFIRLYLLHHEISDSLCASINQKPTTLIPRICLGSSPHRYLALRMFRKMKRLQTVFPTEI